jgi:hypothetical protein
MCQIDAAVANKTEELDIVAKENQMLETKEGLRFSVAVLLFPECSKCEARWCQTIAEGLNPMICLSCCRRQQKSASSPAMRNSGSKPPIFSKAHL